MSWDRLAGSPQAKAACSFRGPPHPRGWRWGGRTPLLLYPHGFHLAFTPPASLRAFPLDFPPMFLQQPQALHQIQKRKFSTVLFNRLQILHPLRHTYIPYRSWWFYFLDQSQTDARTNSDTLLFCLNYMLLLC